MGIDHGPLSFGSWIHCTPTDPLFGWVASHATDDMARLSHTP